MSVGFDARVFQEGNSRTIRILGSLEVTESGHALSLAGRQRALLAFFLLHANEADRLIDALWGERLPATTCWICAGWVVVLPANEA